MRVLIVDDEPRILEMLTDFFGQLQGEHVYEVETARDGAEALTALLRSHFDLVLLDLNMPRLNGLGLLNQLRGLCLRVPVLVITGSQSAELAAAAVTAGAFACVTKPVDLVQLDRLVALALAPSSGAAAGARPSPEAALSGDSVLV